MKLRFEQIDKQGYRVVLDGERLFLPEEDVAVELAGHLLFSKSSGESVILHGELQGSFVGRCSFCADDVPFSFKEKVCCRFSVGEIEEKNLEKESEIDCHSNDLENIYLATPEIDMDEVVQEQVYLNLPLQLLCRQDCAGICPHCGANLNNEKCSCDGAESASPFAVLAKLKK